MKEKEHKPYNIILQEDYTTYLNPSRYCSYFNDINFFLLTGERGLGKTTSLMTWFIKQNIAKEEEFVYIRRYKDEVAAAKNLLDIIVSGVNIKGTGVEGTHVYEQNGKRIGYAVALTVQHKVKSGFDFSKVKNIIFDEAFIKQSLTKRYLKDEVIEFLELISTIVRTRKDYRVFIVGNNLDKFNPYFAFFNIPKFTDKYIDKERRIYCEYCKAKKELKEVQENTPLYQLTKGTKYAEYHYNNKVLTTKIGRVESKPEKLALLYRLIYNKVTLNVYMNDKCELYVELREKVINDSYSFLILENNTPNYYYIEKLKKSSLYRHTFRQFYDNAVIYDSDETIDIFAILMEELG